MFKDYWIPRALLLLCVTMLTMPDDVLAQQIKSPDVDSSGHVTLRLRAGSAQKVHVLINGRQLDLTKADRGTWSVTIEDLPAGIHDYAFVVDGTRMIDPSNRMVKKWFTLASMVEVPGNPPLLTELTDVPHGEIRRIMYPSKSVGHQRPAMIYTPPQYAQAPDRFPVLLLLHGFGDDETAWTEVGRAHFISDNLIARKKIQPCVIVMPYGHPIPPPYGKRPDNYFPDNADLYERDLMQDLVPYLTQRFLVKPEPEHWLIAGLSMGGGHAIDTGLKNADRFAAIGAFSSAAPQLPDDKLLEKYPALRGPDPAANRLRHLWIPIGRSDFLLERNDAFVSQLEKLQVKHVYHKTDGGHEWKLWRQFLADFLQMTLPAAE